MLETARHKRYEEQSIRRDSLMRNGNDADETMKSIINNSSTTTAATMTTSTNPTTANTSIGTHNMNQLELKHNNFQSEYDRSTTWNNDSMPNVVVEGGGNVTDPSATTFYPIDNPNHNNNYLLNQMIPITNGEVEVRKQYVQPSSTAYQHSHQSTMYESNQYYGMNSQWPQQQHQQQQQPQQPQQQQYYSPMEPITSTSSCSSYESDQNAVNDYIAPICNQQPIDNSTFHYSNMNQAPPPPLSQQEQIVLNQIDSCSNQHYDQQQQQNHHHQNPIRQQNLLTYVDGNVYRCLT